jgi:L-asparaginase type II
VTRISLVATGGTIQNTPGEKRISPSVVIDEAISAYRTGYREPVPEVRVDDIGRAGSEYFTPDDWIRIGTAVRRNLEDDSTTGVVVTHGTFTAEESAYFLHLTIPTDRPIVVVCAQRKHGTIGYDGARNLLDAFRVVESPDAVGKGVVLVVNEEIHCAREVSKSNQRPGGFTSRQHGILGSVERDQPTFYRLPVRRHTARSEFDVDNLRGVLPRVDIVSTYAGADGAAVPGQIAAGAQGLIVNGFAFDGKFHELQREALEAAISQGVKVVLVSRGGGGRVPRGPAPFIYGDNLSPQKARVLLAVALSKTRDTDELQRIFDEY